MLKGHFSRAFADSPDRLHFAAHSHHLWPDVTFDAQQQHWLDAARLADTKWQKVLGDVLPEAQRWIARRLGLSRPEAIAVGPSVHDFLVRILSCFRPGQRLRILATDGEFHSFQRQALRLEEAGTADVERVAVEPFESFPERFSAAAAAGGHDLVYFSQVFFNSGYAVPDLAALIAAIPSHETFVVVDGYHGFMALPTDLSALEERIFYTAGGYKYAMSGEGICFLHCPPGFGLRPRDTGWFAAFGDLSQSPEEATQRVPYSPDGYRFFGATFDHTGLYRLVAVQRWLDQQGVDVAAIHRHVQGLQAQFLDQLPSLRHHDLSLANLLPGREIEPRGHFLTFRTPQAGELHALLTDAGIATDYRDDRLRFGFGVYHQQDDVSRLMAALQQLP